MERVVVMMSTYNGGLYLREQMDSLFSQEGVDLLILIRDDGSDDNTLAIIKDYQRKNPGKIEMIEGDNIGWKKSFFALMQYAHANYGNRSGYFAFCDQDDIWLPKKLSRAVSCLSQSSSSVKLYFSNLSLYRDGKNIGLVRNGMITPSYKNCLLRNYAAGCTIVMNKGLLDLLAGDIPKIDIAHDHWVYIVGVLMGKVYVDDESYIFYRQHSANQIGHNKKIMHIWENRFKNKSLSLKNHPKEGLANEIMRIYGDSLNEEAYSSVEKLAQYRKNPRNRIKLMLDKGYSYNKQNSDFWLKIKILMGNL